MMPLVLHDLVELVNESLVCYGSGVFGMVSVLSSGSPKNYVRYLGYTAVGAASMLALLNKRPMRSVDPNHVVIVTGCDSGLGHNIARKCYNLNMFVVAACYDLQSEGAQQLVQLWDPKRSRVVQLNLRDPSTIRSVYQEVSDLLADHPALRLSAVVNNAGVMGFGEFEWQTDDQVFSQIDVNLLGTMRFTHQFLPLCRQHKSRIICVSSHCAIQALPALAPYSASKAGIASFVDSLRVEMRKYGVDVINFTPGSFVMNSNILAGQDEFSLRQRAAFDDEQTRFYGEYFNRFQEFMQFLSGKRPVEVFGEKDGMMRTFEAALLEQGPRALYKYEPTWRYRIYQKLLKLAPTELRDHLVLKFVGLPTFKNSAA